MSKHTLTWFVLIAGLLMVLLLPRNATAGVDDISVVELTEENVLIRGRTTYYTYRLNIMNNGDPLRDVSATVSSQSRALRVTEGSLQFGNVDSNQVVPSSDEFTIRVGSRSTPDLSLLIYTFRGEEVIIDDDKVAPTIVAQLSQQANANGWHNAPVTISFTCSDDKAIASCNDDVTVTEDGANQIIIGTAIDTSGNTATVQVSINLDTTAPSILANLSNGSDTPPTDQSTLLQNITIDTLSEPQADINIFEIDNNEDFLVGAFSSDGEGKGRLSDIRLELGITEFRARAKDIADNQGETLLNVERLTCSANGLSQPFYLQSPIVANASLLELEPTSDSFKGVYHQFVGDANSPVSVVPGFINDDVLLDWIVLDGDEAAVTVIINDGSGVFNGGMIKTTGFSTPVAAVLSNLIDSEALDLAVAHEDGAVAIFAGRGDGSFDTQANEVFVSAEPIVDIISNDFNDDGFDDLLVLTASSLELLARNNAQTILPVISNGDFNNGLSGWMVNASGHKTQNDAGRVTRSANGAQFFENGSFLVSLYQQFTLSGDSTSLSFNISSLNLESSSGAIPDVLEVSLLNSSNQSLVPTFHPNATSFLNIQADGTVNAASGVTYSNGRATVNISSVVDDVTLYFDLIGHPPERGATFIVSNVDAGESMMVDNSYTSTLISSGFTDANGAVYCDAVSDAPPIIVSNEGAGEIIIFKQNDAAEFVVSSVLAQGGQ